MQNCSSVCDITVSMCFGHPSLSDLFFIGKALLYTQTGQLDPELYDMGSKNMDSTVPFTIAPIATWSDPLNHIHSLTYGITLHLHVFHF